MSTTKLLRTISLSGVVSFASMFIFSCKSNTAPHHLYNESASSTGKIDNRPVMELLNGHMVTLLKNTKTKTIAVLYANNIAFKSVKENKGDYGDGAKLALVTWIEKPDIHWFGALIPGKIASIQQISITVGADGRTLPKYNSYKNTENGLVPVLQADSLLVRKNTNFILGLRRPYLPD